jgi:trehalose/maltose transport system substrate-binding protein
MIGKRFSIFALFVIVSLLIASCGAEATPTSAPAPPTATTAPVAAPTDTTAPAAAPTDTTAPAAAPTDTTAPAAAATNTTAPAAGGMTKDNPPPVANAAAAKAFASQSIKYYGDTVGLGAELDQAAAKRFTADTGIAVQVIPKPESATENYSTYQRFFQAQSADIDVMMLDVIWPGAFAPHLLDLTEKLGTEAKQHYPGIIENNTVDGKLVAIPWFGDFGMLYYRTDLLQKYGFSAPPTTWDELQTQAQKIMDGEKASNANFTGFVFQGNSYEGLTCDALEWVASNGGGLFVENGKATINNPQAIEILNKAKGWVGTIAPKGVTTYQEEDARNVFQSGNAAFMRNWPYAYAAAKTPDKDGKVSVIADKFDVAPLPHGANGQSSGTVGGWQLGVSKYSKNQDAAVEFVRYLTSPEVETWRAVVGSYVPTIASVAENADVVKAMPFLKNLASVQRVTRPSRDTGIDYNEASTAIFQGVNQILKGEDAAAVLPGVEQKLNGIVQK